MSLFLKQFVREFSKNLHLKIEVAIDNTNFQDIKK